MGAKTTNHIDYVEFSAPDFAAVQAFYGAAFGWRFEAWGETYLAFHGAGLEGGFARREPDAEAPTGGALVILYADDLEAARERVLAAGGALTADIFAFPGGRRFQFSDPAGNELGVWTTVPLAASDDPRSESP